MLPGINFSEYAGRNYCSFRTGAFFKIQVPWYPDKPERWALSYIADASAAQVNKHPKFPTIQWLPRILNVLNVWSWKPYDRQFYRDSQKLAVPRHVRGHLKWTEIILITGQFRNKFLFLAILLHIVLLCVYFWYMVLSACEHIYIQLCGEVGDPTSWFP